MTLSPPLPLVAALAVVLAAASAAHAGGPAICNGKHKRPANPYGSVLATGLKPAAAPPRPVAVSRARPTSLTACGSRG